MNPPWVSRIAGTVVLAGAVVIMPAALSQQIQAGPEQDEALLKADANLVVLDVSVTHPNGSPVTGLTQDHFQIVESGKAQRIRLHSGEETQVTLGLVLDVSSSMEKKIARLRRSVSTLLGLSSPGDDFFVAGFNDAVRFPLGPGQPFSSSPEVVLKAIESLRAAGRTTLRDGLAAALKRIRTSRHERRVLVLVSDGKDTASTTSFAEIIALVRSSPVTIYTIGLFEEGDPDSDSGFLKRLAGISGGRYSRPDRQEELEETCRRVANDIRARYILSYTPPELPKCGVRKISVRVNGSTERRLQVRARREYTASGFDPVCK